MYSGGDDGDNQVKTMVKIIKKVKIANQAKPVKTMVNIPKMVNKMSKIANLDKMVRQMGKLEKAINLVRVANLVKSIKTGKDHNLVSPV